MATDFEILRPESEEEFADMPICRTGKDNRLFLDFIKKALKDYTELENSLIGNWEDMFDHPESLAKAIFHTKLMFVFQSLQSMKRVKDKLKGTGIPTEPLDNALFEGVCQIAGAIEEFKKEFSPEEMLALNRLLYQINKGH